jgi:hypothetical protein
MGGARFSPGRVRSRYLARRPRADQSGALHRSLLPALLMLARWPSARPDDGSQICGNSVSITFGPRRDLLLIYFSEITQMGEEAAEQSEYQGKR